MIRFFLKITFLGLLLEASAIDYVLTYPKSGTHWFLYSLTYLTQRDAFSDQRFSALLEINPDLPGMDHLHYFTDPEALDDGQGFIEGDRMILLLRDFKESIPRARHEAYDDILSLVDSMQEEYLTNLQAFALLPEASKLVVYYEDLCRFPEKTLRQVLQFLKEDEARVDLFIKNFEFHRNQSLSYYNHQETYGGTQSRGEDLQFHQKRAPEGFNQKLEELFLKVAPELSKKYLARYFSRSLED